MDEFNNFMSYVAELFEKDEDYKNRVLSHFKDDKSDDQDCLLPCPFCGKPAVIQEDVRYPKDLDDGIKAYESVCINPNCVIYKCDNTYFLSMEDAINAWNTRYHN